MHIAQAGKDVQMIAAIAERGRGERKTIIYKPRGKRRGACKKYWRVKSVCGWEPLAPRTVFPVHKAIICERRKKCNLLFEIRALSTSFAQVECLFHTLLTVEPHKPIDNPSESVYNIWYGR